MCPASLVAVYTLTTDWDAISAYSAANISDFVYSHSMARTLLRNSLILHGFVLLNAHDNLKGSMTWCE